MEINSRVISRLRRIDWDFSGSQSESYFSALHWHPSRFASQLPASLIGVLSEPGEFVVDPFAGSGTTLVEAQRLGRPSIGIDVNPVACLAARAKILPLRAAEVRLRADELKREANECTASVRLLSASKAPAQRIPSSVQHEKWYTPRVRKELAALWNLIAGYDGAKRVLAEAAFSAVLLPVCRETRHWGYVCDNSTPAGRHEGDVANEYGTVLTRISRAYEERDQELVARDGTWKDVVSAEIVEGDAVGVLQNVAEESAKLIVTSPPYFGVCDYVKAQRLSMEWFGLDIEEVRLAEIGARSKGHRKAAVEEYLSELESVFEACFSRLRTDGYLCVIIGQARSRQPVMQQLLDRLRRVGLELQVDINPECRHKGGRRQALQESTCGF